MTYLFDSLASLSNNRSCQLREKTKHSFPDSNSSLKTVTKITAVFESLPEVQFQELQWKCTSLQPQNVPCNTSGPNTGGIQLGEPVAHLQKSYIDHLWCCGLTQQWATRTTQPLTCSSPLQWNGEHNGKN